MSDQAVSIKLGYMPLQACDKIPDETMAEIVRRLTFAAAIGGGLGIPYYSPTPPADKSRPWIVTNSAGLPTGKTKVYNFGSGQWEDGAEAEEDAPREMVTRKKSISVTANGSYVVEWDDDFEDADYQASVVATSSPAAATFYKSGQTEGTVSIVVAGYSIAFTVEVTATGYLLEDEA